MAAATLPLLARRNRFRRTDTRPLALACSITSLHRWTLRRRSTVLVLTPRRRQSPRRCTAWRTALQFSEVDLCLRVRHALSPPFQQPQLRTPIRQRQTQALEVRMPGPDLGFDDRNLLAATRDSCHLPLADDLLECAAVTVELGFLTAERLPPLHDHVHILGVQLDAVADPLSEFRGSER